MLAAAGLLLGGAGLSLARPESSLPSRVACSMYSNGKRVRKREHYVASTRAAFQPGDEVVGEYSRERLIRMNDRFVERVERPIVAGDESPQGTASLASTR